MTADFSYWAQALDNSSPDHIVLQGKNTSPEDDARRKEVVRLISSVVKHGVQIIENSSLSLTVDSRHFVIEIQSTERDIAGRIAPLICHGELDESKFNTLGESVFEGLSIFAKNIGRKISSNYSKLIQDAFMELKKKRKRKAHVKILFLVGLASAIAATVFIKTTLLK